MGQRTMFGGKNLHHSFMRHHTTAKEYLNNHGGSKASWGFISANQLYSLIFHCMQI